MVIRFDRGESGGSQKGNLMKLSKYTFDNSKYNQNAREMFGGFTPYNPPDSSYYRELGRKARLMKEEEEEQKKLEEEQKKKEKEASKSNSLLEKYGVGSDDSSLSVKSDDYFSNEESKKEVKQPSVKKKDDRNTLTKLKDFFSSKDVDGDGNRDGLLGAVDRFVVPISKGLTDVIDPSNTERMAKNHPDNPVIKAAQADRGLETKALNTVGELIGFAAPYAKGYKAAEFAVNKLPKLAKIANPYAKKAIIGATAGGLAEGGVSAIQEFNSPESNDLKDHALRTGLGVVGGAVLDPAMLKIANIIKGARKPVMDAAEKAVKPTTEPPKQLALPAPKEPGLADRLKSLSPNRKMEDFSFGRQFSDSFEKPVNQYGVEIPFDPVEHAPTGYWRNRYESFAKHVQENYDLDKMSKEGLDDLWSQFAKYDEPVNLEQLVDLAYKQVDDAPVLDARNVNIDRPSVSNRAKSIMGVDDSAFNIDGLPKNNTLERFRQSLNPNNEVAAAIEPKLPPTLKRPGKDFEAITTIPKEASLKRLKSESIEPEPSFERLNTQQNKADVSNINSIQNLKDLKQFQVGTTDLYRLANKLTPELKSRITGTLDNAKEANVKLQTALTDDLYEKVVKGLGITKGSKESALVQDFGEKTLAKDYLKKQGIDSSKLSPEEIDKINIDQLKQKHPEKWKDILEADSYFRKQYDALINQVNRVRSEIYPNQPDRIVPKRTDYYHHFKELTGFEGLKNIIDTPSNIDPKLEGISPFLKPKAKFQGFMQARKMGSYKSDAVGGFLKYLQAASHSINIDPVIPVLRKTANEIADVTTDTRNANNIIEALQKHANDLAGKTNSLDRVMQETFGRTSMSALNWLNSRVKANMVLGNISSAIAQLGNVPLGVGKAKLHSVPALKDTVGQMIKEIMNAEKKGSIYKSEFLKERYIDKKFRRFDSKLINQPHNMALWMMGVADESASRYIWNAMYRKGIQSGVKNPIKYADYETRNIVAGRGVGEMPLAQKSKTLQVFAPFTLEVGNQWRVLRELVDEKDAAGIITFAAAAFGLNKATEYVRGSGISFDPIGALIEGYSKKDGDTKDKLTHALASLLGEVVGNYPGGNLLTQLVNTDKNVPFSDIKYKDLFGENDPNRFGTGLTVAKAIEDPAFVIAPFGAYQARKAEKAYKALKNEGEYKVDKDGDKNILKFPVNNDLLTSLQALTMGINSIPDAREYYDNKRKPLSEKQTAEYELLKKHGVGDQYYNDLMNTRKVNSVERQIKEIDQNDKLTHQEKQEKIMRLIYELRKLEQ